MIYDIVIGYLTLSLACGSALIMLAIRERAHVEAREPGHIINDEIDAEEGSPETNVPFILTPQQDDGQAEQSPISLALSPRQRSGGFSG